MVDLGQMFDISGKTAIVTGASSGLGVTFAEALAAAGANVVLAARRTEQLEALANRITDGGGAALAVRCDVGDAEDVAALVAQAWGHFGRVDILVNNAGVSAEAGVMPERIPTELFDQTMRVNVNGTFYGCREVAARQLQDGQGGSIINVSSIMGLAGQAQAPAAYQASKAAVVNLTRNLAASWADRGVRVNCIAPGWFPSEMTAGWFSIPVALERFTNQAPMQRVGNPEELIGALLFFASDASSFVTGQTLAVDGGLSAMVSTPYNDELYEAQAAVVGELGTRIMPEPA